MFDIYGVSFISQKISLSCFTVCNGKAINLGIDGEAVAGRGFPARAGKLDGNYKVIKIVWK